MYIPDWFPIKSLYHLWRIRAISKTRDFGGLASNIPGQPHQRFHVDNIHITLYSNQLLSVYKGGSVLKEMSACQFLYAIPLLIHLVLGCPKASTRYGELEGFTYPMKNGKEAQVFLGIPYASPPIDDARFEVVFFFQLHHLL